MKMLCRGSFLFIVLWLMFVATAQAQNILVSDA